MAKWDFRSDDEEYVGLGPYDGHWKSEELANSLVTWDNTNVFTWVNTNPYVIQTSPGTTLKLNTGTPLPKFKFNENVYIREADLYIQDTYKQHYGGGQYQATDMIIDAGHGEAFCIGNIMKYAMRYGKKNGYDRKDLLKIIHYAIIALHCLDEKKEKDVIKT